MATPPFSSAPSLPEVDPNDPVVKRQVRAFGLWDWGISAFNSVILTFVFVTYLTNAVSTAGLTDPEAITAAKDSASTTLATSQMVGSLLIALLAPLLGGLADTGGMRNVFLNLFSIGTAGSIALMAFIAPHPSYLLAGCILISLALVFSELAAVFSNSVLPQISDENNRGRVSGNAWALGYFGSIICLVLVLIGFVMPNDGLLGITTDESWNLRAIPIFVAVWILVFTLPLMLRAPASPKDPNAPSWNAIDGYVQIARHLKRMAREEPVTLKYLIASAVYRDGLGAIFSLAGVIAAAAYGFDTTETILFGIAANLVAGFGVYLGGKIDDLLGPRIVIIGGLVSILAVGIMILAIDAKAMFWVGGLMLSFFVGPIQSASRTLLTRLSLPGHETEDFGLYATTGRALGFLGTSAFAITVSLFGATRMGIVGIMVVMAVGLAMFSLIKLGEDGHGSHQRAKREQQEA
ncbi:MFS transporter [Dermabacteraceae bacterium P13138]